jgi:hypothetical protein
VFRAARQQLDALSDVLKLVRKTDYLTTVQVAQPQSQPDLPVLLASKRKALNATSERLGSALAQLSARVAVDNVAAKQLAVVTQRYRCRHSSNVVVVDCGLSGSHLGDSADVEASLSMPKPDGSLGEPAIELRKPLQCTAPIRLSCLPTDAGLPTAWTSTAANCVTGGHGQLPAAIAQVRRSLVQRCAFEMLVADCQSPVLAPGVVTSETSLSWTLPSVSKDGQPVHLTFHLQHGKVVEQGAESSLETAECLSTPVVHTLLLLLELIKREPCPSLLESCK